MRISDWSSDVCSSDLKKRDSRYRGMKANRLVQRRLESLCGFLATNSDRFAVVTLEEAARRTEPERASPLRGQALRAALRAAAHVVHDRLWCATPALPREAKRSRPYSTPLRRSAWPRAAPPA